ncbi:MAG TPA: PorP/SprF family type IX secretion system membrane protein [Flavobacteriales bacterium]
MRRSLLLLPVVLFAFIAPEASAQDVHFTQYGMQPLLQSPAMAGIGHDLRAVLQHRNQWASVTTPFTTTAFSYDMQLKQKKGSSGFMAVGLNFFSDKAGDSKLKSTQGGLSLAYHVKTGTNSTIGAGLFGGFGQRSIDPSALQWGEQYDGQGYNGNLPTGESVTATSFTFVDLGLGGVWHYNSSSGAKDVVANQSTQATLGFGYFHVTRPTYTFLSAEEQLYAKLVLHGNARFAIGEGNAAVIPSFQYTKQGPTSEFVMGAMFRYVLTPTSKVTGLNKGSALSLGPVIRMKDAVAVAALLEMGRMAVGFSYDLNTSNLRKASNGAGGFELALRFVNPNPFNGRTKSRD